VYLALRAQLLVDERVKDADAVVVRGLERVQFLRDSLQCFGGYLTKPQTEIRMAIRTILPGHPFVQIVQHDGFDESRSHLRTEVVHDTPDDVEIFGRLVRVAADPPSEGLLRGPAPQPAVGLVDQHVARGALQGEVVAGDQMHAHRREIVLVDDAEATAEEHLARRLVVAWLAAVTPYGKVRRGTGGFDFGHCREGFLHVAPLGARADRTHGDDP